MKKFVCIFLFCSVALVSKGQLIDSLQSAIERDGNFSFSFNSRNSFIGNNNAYIFGFNIGVCFGKKFTIGGGINTLSSTIYDIKYVGLDTIKKKLNFYFFSYFVQYTVNLSKHWRVDLPLSIGIGGAFLQYTDEHQIINESNRLIIPFEPQLELDYNFNRYCGLYAQTGYRFMLVNNNLLDYNFNSVTYSVGVLIYPLEIYAGIFPRTKLGRMIDSN